MRSIASPSLAGVIARLATSKPRNGPAGSLRAFVRVSIAVSAQGALKEERLPAAKLLPISSAGIATGLSGSNSSLEASIGVEPDGLCLNPGGVTAELSGREGESSMIDNQASQLDATSEAVAVPPIVTLCALTPTA